MNSAIQRVVFVGNSFCGRGAIGRTFFFDTDEPIFVIPLILGDFARGCMGFLCEVAVVIVDIGVFLIIGEFVVIVKSGVHRFTISLEPVPQGIVGEGFRSRTYGLGRRNQSVEIVVAVGQ